MVTIKKRLYFLSLLATVVIFSSVPLVSMGDPDVESAVQMIVKRRAQRRSLEQDQRELMIKKLRLLRQRLRAQGFTEQEIEEEIRDLDPDVSQPMTTSVAPQGLQYGGQRPVDFVAPQGFPYEGQGPAEDDLLGSLTKLGQNYAIQTALGIATAPLTNAASAGASYVAGKGWDATKAGMGLMAQGLGAAGTGALSVGGTVASGVGTGLGSVAGALPSVSFAIPTSNLGKLGLAAGAAGSLAAWYLFNQYRKEKALRETLRKTRKPKREKKYWEGLDV